jgi:transcriptional regulator of NAD metabolism
MRGGGENSMGGNDAIKKSMTEREVIRQNACILSCVTSPL